MVFSVVARNTQSRFLGEKCHWWQAERYRPSPKNMLCMWNYFVNYFAPWSHLTFGKALWKSCLRCTASRIQAPGLDVFCQPTVGTAKNTLKSGDIQYIYSRVFNSERLPLSLKSSPFFKAAMGWNPPLQKLWKYSWGNLLEKMSCSTTRGFILQVFGANLFLCFYLTLV